jgi:hypothetical protein
MLMEDVGRVIQFVPVAAAVIAALLTGVVTLSSLWFQRRQEKLTVTRAILAEVSRLLAILPKHLSWWDACQAQGDTEVPLIPFSTDVYDKLSDRLGHLPPNIVGTVVNFYGFIKFINAIQITRTYYTQANRPANFAKFYSAELASVASAFSPLVKDAFDTYGVLSPERQPIVGSA